MTGDLQLPKHVGRALCTLVHPAIPQSTTWPGWRRLAVSRTFALESCGVSHESMWSDYVSCCTISGPDYIMAQRLVTGHALLGAFLTYGIFILPAAAQATSQRQAWLRDRRSQGRSADGSCPNFPSSHLLNMRVDALPVSGTWRCLYCVISASTQALTVHTVHSVHTALTVRDAGL